MISLLLNDELPRHRPCPESDLFKKCVRGYTDRQTTNKQTNKQTKMNDNILRLDPSTSVTIPCTLVKGAYPHAVPPSEAWVFFARNAPEHIPMGFACSKCYLKMRMHELPDAKCCQTQRIFDKQFGDYVTVRYYFVKLGNEVEATI
jgi:hypothetical protein